MDRGLPRVNQPDWLTGSEPAAAWSTRPGLPNRQAASSSYPQAEWSHPGSQPEAPWRCRPEVLPAARWNFASSMLPLRPARQGKE